MVRLSIGYCAGMDPIEADAAPDQSRTAPPSDNTTLAEVLTGLEELGFDGNLTVVEGARLRCGRCGDVSPAGGFDVVSIRRLEGASEADEMVSVVAAVCPRCAGGGAVVLGYGAAASQDDADVSIALRPPDRPGA
jgi:ribosomal protein S27AE